MKHLLEKLTRGDRKRLLKNFLSLSALQGFNYILPLVTLPYLARVLGPDRFGLVMFVQAAIQYFMIVTEYGFNLSAPKEIAMQKNNLHKLSEILSSVLCIKTSLAIAGFFLLLLIGAFVPEIRNEWKLYLFSFCTVFGMLLLPTWFFQGMEQMKYITLLNFMAKIIYTISIFLLIRDTSDYYLVPMLNSSGLFIAGITALFLIRTQFGIRIYIPSFSIAARYIRESTEYFLSRVFVMVYTNSNTFVIGLMLGNTAAGFFAAAEKLFNAMTSFYNPLNDSLFPYMSGKRDVPLYKKIFRIVVILNTLLCLVLIGFSEYIIHFIYGAGYSDSVQLLQIFGLLGILMVPSILLGYPFLAAMGHPKYANRSVMIASVVHLIALLTTIHLLSIYLVGWLLIFTQLIVLSIRIYGVNRHRLFAVTS